jgi:hypothetical protein
MRKVLGAPLEADFSGCPDGEQVSRIAQPGRGGSGRPFSLFPLDRNDIEMISY